MYLGQIDPESWDVGIGLFIYCSTYFDRNYMYMQVNF